MNKRLPTEVDGYESLWDLLVQVHSNLLMSVVKPDALLQPRVCVISVLKADLLHSILDSVRPCGQPGIPSKLIKKHL